MIYARNDCAHVNKGWKGGPGRPKGRKRKGMSAQGRARVAAAQKARWAKIRKARGGEVGNG